MLTKLSISFSALSVLMLASGLTTGALGAAQQVSPSETATPAAASSPSTTWTGHNQMMYLEGDVRLMSADYPKAIELYKAVLDKDENNVRARHGLARAYYSQGNYNDALDEIKKAQKSDPADANLYYTRAQILEGQDKPKEAMFDYLTFAILRPDDLTSMNAYRQAIQCHERIKSELNEQERLRFEGMQALAVGQTDKGLPLMEHSLNRDKNNLNTLLLIGATQLRLNNPQKAIPYFDTAIKVEENATWPLYYLGKAYDWSGDKKKAVDYWKRYVNQAPHSTITASIMRQMESVPTDTP